MITAFSMASWLFLNHWFFLLLLTASSGVTLSFERDLIDKNVIDKNPRDLSVPKSESTTLNKTLRLDLPWPATRAPSTPASIDTSPTQAGNVYNKTNAHLTEPRVRCDARAFGQGLNIDSCQEVWELLPTSVTRRTVGLRTEGTFDIPLPFRVLSSDGRCAVDITNKRSVTSDISTGDEISRAASLVLDLCVKGYLHKGGVAVDVGDSGGLAVRFVSYDPSFVGCTGTRSSPGNCREVLDTMPASYDRQFFGPRNRGPPLADVELPQTFTGPSGGCAITVNTIGRVTAATWYMIYVAATAVDAMCVRRGLTGVASHIGSEGSLTVLIKSGVNEVASS